MMTDETPTAAESPAPPPPAPAGTEEPKVPAPAPDEAPPPAEHPTALRDEPTAGTEFVDAGAGEAAPPYPPDSPEAAPFPLMPSATDPGVSAETKEVTPLEELARDQAEDPTAVVQAGESAERSESEPVEAPPYGPPEAAAVVEPPSNKHWYVVKVQSGREESIKEAIEKKVKIEGLEEYFGRIFIPTEKVTEMRRGKRYTRERKVLPGYIMAEVEYNDRILYLFRETSGVGDFVGAQPHSNRPPPPMSSREVQKWLGTGTTPAGEDAPIKHDFEKGDRVKVKEGMFKEMEGEIKEIIEAKNQVKVELTIFGRPVLVEMEYWQVERI
ncbi:MAG: transcription termination/antitermination factor NusG [Planctomycetes bacterium]|nr:transcription termination/antitermination factor NusG [Planctomycetota bacterium]